MKIIFVLIMMVFLISFLLLFKLIYSGEKKPLEEKEGNLFHVCLAAFVLALIPTVVIALFIFMLLGSTNAVNLLFSLDLNMKQLVILTISFFVYLFFIDGIIETSIKIIVGENSYLFILQFLIHIFTFYIIGLLVQVKQTSNFMIAIGVSLMILLLEVLYGQKEKGRT